MNDPSRLSVDELARSRDLFREYGYLGSLQVVDDSGDEAIFLVPDDAVPAIPHAELAHALQQLLGRKVWIADREWSDKGRAV